ncbi:MULTISPECIES: hypothetical protein [Erwinia]|uniref:hypothetical protein n=1 Tax=Erwinia TaxID=551 RepID=UPI0005571762|nr:MULTISPECIES: hypothetical protein [Erwinia]
MFAKLKQMFNSQAPEEEQGNNEEAERIEAELSVLEAELEKNPSNGDVQKNLMVKYNQAIKIFSKNKRYRQKVDDLFLKMDELRNTIRKNI